MASLAKKENTKLCTAWVKSGLKSVIIKLFFIFQSIENLVVFA